MNKRICGLIVLVSCGVLPLRAETLELFNAVQVPIDNWVWGDAKIRARGDALVVSEINRTADYGGVFVENYLPYHPEAVIELDVREVVSGHYTLQILSFLGKTHIDSLNAVENETRTGKVRIRLADLSIPDECQAVVLKFWVGGEEGASTVLGNLTYSLELDPDRVVADEVFASDKNWTAHDLTFAPGADGGVLSLVSGKGFGNITYGPVQEKKDGQYLLVQAGDVSSSVLTLQLAALSGDGQYLGAVDAIRNFGSGWRGIQIGKAEWSGVDAPASYQIKLWLAGDPGGRAVLKRILLLEP